MKKITFNRRHCFILQPHWLWAFAGIMLLAFSSTPEAAPRLGGYGRASYILPQDIQKQGLTFADIKIPLDRREVALRVVDQVNYLLMDRRAGIMECLDRMAIFGPTILSILKDERVPADLLYISALLSDLLPNTRTKAGGVGWWALGANKDKKNSSSVPWIVTNDWDDRRDPVLSTRIAINILQRLLRNTTNSDWLLAIAAFADGADKIDPIVQKAPGFSYWEMVMPPYSDVLIPRAVALKIIDTHRQFYGVDVPPLPPLPHDFLDRLKLVKDLPLYVVAKWCQTNPRSIWELNPGVEPSTGVLPKPDSRSPSGFPLRVPKGMGNDVRKLLIREGYLTE